MFGVAPDIKIISFGVRRLKNRRVTPNGEEVKDEKSNFLWAHEECVEERAALLR
jgi:hypothetical protein